MEGEKFVDYLNIKGLCCSAPLRDQLLLESEYSVTVLMFRVRMCSSLRTHVLHFIADGQCG
jgi:hypothetical protein